jgi:hypothetical protein
VHVRGRHGDGGGARCENNRCDDFCASLRPAVFTSSTRSFSNKS